MGQTFSKQLLFATGLKDSLKSGGTRVKKMDLKKFLDFVGEICPWFPQEGMIGVKMWHRAGDCFKDYYKAFGLTKIPVTTNFN